MFIKNCIELRRIECLDFRHLRGTLRASRGWLEVPDHVACGTGLQDVAGEWDGKVQDSFSTQKLQPWHSVIAML